MDFQTTTLRAMRDLAPADLDRAYAGVVTGEWVIVVVGDATSLRAEVEGLGIGPVTVVPN